MNNLKNYRDNELKWYILAYLFLIVWVCNLTWLENSDIDSISKVEKLAASVLLSGIICSLSFVFDSIYSAQLKDRLVFFRRSLKPGDTIFSRIKKCTIKDDRISVEKACKQYADIINALPSEKKEKYQYENNQWYCIYARNKEDPSVGWTHRDSLLCRDLYIATITLFMLTVVAMIVHMLSYSNILIGYLLIMLVLTNIAARNKAHRFVNSVISSDLK